MFWNYVLQGVAMTGLIGGIVLLAAAVMFGVVTAGEGLPPFIKPQWWAATLIAAALLGIVAMIFGGAGLAALGQ